MKEMVRSNELRIVFLALLFIAILLARSPALFIGPRFWAEEGTFYYSRLQDEGFLSIFTVVVRGNYQFLTNLFVYLSTLVPAKWAAHVTTYLSLLIPGAAVVIFGALARQIKWPFILSILGVAIFALLPHGYEIYLSATNVQWICSVCVLLISVLELERVRRIRKAIIYTIVVFCGLTGVPSVMLAPIFLVRRFVDHSETHFRIGLILCLCALGQVAVLASHAHSDRMLPIDFYTILAPTILQTIMSPLIGAEYVDKIIMPLKHGEGAISAHFAIVAILLAAGFVSVFSFFAFKAAENKLVPVALIFSWIWISTLNVVGSIGDPKQLISGWGGGRYFFLGAVCMILLAVLATKSDNRFIGRAAVVFLLAMLISGAVQSLNGDWKNWMITGNSWKSQVERCGPVRPCAVEAWPGGKDWEFKLNHW